MRKILSVLAMVLFAVQFVSAKDVVTTDGKSLPKNSQTFIQQYFPNSAISYIKIDNEFFKSKKYEVVLTNGTEIDFDSRGNWMEVDAKKAEIPAELIPDYVKNYLSANFKKEYITQIEKDRRGIEVELNNDLSLRFDRNGNLVEIDD
ncbi:PepSY-like domain-containing protein [Bacteroides sp. 224]|uniref:PepSY-like domain-containing protein n=1 Tax=Bacteroides sp. 224 TaxID=2302936 RepID=UPI0013D2FD05|nr:PepSY-like domain-containing protein [Bacteroides sp. 224]NDV65139.1 hypothetical protein [Bacteroides sp. 224]